MSENYYGLGMDRNSLVSNLRWLSGHVYDDLVYDGDTVSDRTVREARELAEESLVLASRWGDPNRGESFAPERALANALIRLTSAIDDAEDEPGTPFDPMMILELLLAVGSAELLRTVCCMPREEAT